MNVEITQMKERVAKLLTGYLHLRDNDNALIANIWHQDMKAKGMDTKNIPAYSLLDVLSSGGLSSTESITRARRKVQEEQVRLRGYKYNKRQENQAEIIAQVRTPQCTFCKDSKWITDEESLTVPCHHCNKEEKI